MKQRYCEVNECEVHSKIKTIIRNGGVIHHVVVACGTYMIIYS
jgi:hypothetical protein